MNRRRSAAGFTLVELLVSALILSFILAGFASLFHYAGIAWQKTITSQEKAAGYYAAIDFMIADLHSAVPPYAQQPDLAMVGYNATDAIPFTLSDRQFAVLQFHAAGYNSSQVDGSAVDVGSDVNKRMFCGRWSGTGTDTRLCVSTVGAKYKEVVPAIPDAMSAYVDLSYRVDGLDFYYYPDSGPVCITNWDSRSSKQLPRYMYFKLTSQRNNVKQVIGMGVCPYAQDTYITK